MRPSALRWLLAAALISAFGDARALDAPTTLAVVVAGNQAQAVTPAELALIYRRKKLFWSSGARINPVNLQASDPLRQLFSRAILGQSPAEMQAYWNTMYFNGISPPHVLASPEAVLRFVAQTPGAIGYVPFCEADARVTVVLALTASGPISESAASSACPKHAAAAGGE
jgi:ABC-type phosphate transport system substrate-binding protein